MNKEWLYAGLIGVSFMLGSFIIINVIGKAKTLNERIAVLEAKVAILMQERK